ncbi:concanavalin A-like lectin/glucanase [Ceraceosorus guamensis]|uniref:Concanavalin A-like lectin/glucanase n=1 Tax=Ceraceosorus guamensis TaxID=1522189 RepID=A0A316VMY2_9BASI|nr:concanavalin A-like lectin/glucanase [Ceraceosorus guamensis]PWN38917.1 concanavalin A-like lectin/glucanase [Ceraceosorus guamensis]
MARGAGRLDRAATLALAVALLFIAPSGIFGQIAAQNRLLKSDAIVPIRQASIYNPYVDSNLQNKYWDFGGDAIVDTNKHIRLTQDRPSQAGWLWTRAPLTADNFEIQFEFSIDGKAAGHKPYGDGLAMWLTEERAQPGPVFGSKDYFTGLGIIIDTFANSRHAYSFPRVMGVVGNGIDSYNHAKDGANLEVGGCSVDIRRTSVATKARVTYVKDVFFELALHYQEWDTWESCFKLPNITIPSRPYLGFTAATGDVSDNHDLVSVSTSNIIYKVKSAAELAQHRLEHFPPAGSQAAKAKSKKKSSGWFSKSGSSSGSTPPSSKSSSSGGPGLFASIFGSLFTVIWVLLKWGLIFGTIAAGGYAFMRWRRQKDAKRF